jgi:type II secretory pathway component PulJ
MGFDTILFIMIPVVIASVVTLAYKIGYHDGKRYMQRLQEQEQRNAAYERQRKVLEAADSRRYQRILNPDIDSREADQS